MIQLSVDQYHIGWLCALPSEYAVAKAMLDETHQMIQGQDRSDSNSYTLGRIHNHNVVVACLPAGIDGTNAAAVVATNLSRTFTSVRFGLLVGIGGGIPSPQVDIRLGDIVVSQPTGTNVGVVQYDKGKSLEDGYFERKGQLNKPPTVLLNALANLRAEHEIDDSRVPEFLEQMLERRPKMRKLGYSFPEREPDKLHCSHNLEMSTTCGFCNDGMIIREARDTTIPVIHYGVIASGNQVIKSARHRDLIRDECGGAVCVEMEAAGMMNDFPCLVIRGICDYADSAKNDRWHNYAAATAASFAKELLLYVSPERTADERPIRDTLIQLDKYLELQKEHNVKIERHNQVQEIRYLTDRHRDCHRVFDISNYEGQKNINANAVAGTCRWVLENDQYRHWLASTEADLLWISADPGCGKSVLSKSLVDDWLVTATRTKQNQTLENRTTICYFFFKDNEEQNMLSIALCAILHQLFTHQPHLIQHALPAYDKHQKEKLPLMTDELWRILRSASSDPSATPIICVLDALDECRDSNRKVLINLLCKSYNASTCNAQSRNVLKWLVTSRPHADIETHFDGIPSGLPSIRLRGEDENDRIKDEINLVIGQRVMDMGHRLGLSDVKQAEVTKQLRDMANRTYLWLHLILDHIEIVFKRSPRPNQVPLTLLPATVDQAYEKILARVVDAEDRRYAKMALTIIVGAPRPLSITEMALAFDVATLSPAPNCLTDLSIDAKSLGEKIRGWCGLFVFVMHQRLYLIHQTAKEFLVNNGVELTSNLGLWKHSLHLRHIDYEMAKACISFLCLEDFNSVDHSIEKQPIGVATLFWLASQHWADYVRRVEPILDEAMCSNIDALYDSDNLRMKHWAVFNQRKLPLGRFYVHVRGIHLASFNGHCLALQRLISKCPSAVNQCVIDQASPLSYAAYAEHYEVVKLLLAQPDIDVNIGMPLYWAAEKGNEAILKLLLARPEVDVNLGEPLSVAAFKGNGCVTELLLAHPGIDVNLKEPLLLAVGKGHAHIAEILLNHAEVDVNRRAPLCVAARSGCRSVADLLLAHPRIDVNYGYPLAVAAENGRSDMVELLLNQKGIDVNHGGPLSCAANFGHAEIVKQLLADTRTLVNFCKPLCKAATNGHTEVVQLLLNRPDIDVNLGAPINEACRKGHVGIVQLLLKQTKIQVDLQHLLALSAEKGHEGIVELLLAQEGKPNVQLGPLTSLAARNGHEKVVRLFLAEPDLRDVDLQLLLIWACYYGHKEVTQTLLAQPDIDLRFGLPLCKAASSGHLGIVELLLAHPKIDVNLGCPLEKAVENGHTEIVELLRAQPGIKIDSRRMQSLTQSQKIKENGEAVSTSPENSDLQRKPWVIRF